MSAGMGYAPTSPLPFDPNALTPEDQARIAAQMAAPAPVGLPPVPPAAGPAPSPASPSPTGIDSIDPGAIANQIGSVGQPPPQVVPPPAAPAPPAATAAPAETPRQTDDLKAAQTEEQKAREASDKATLDFQRAQEPVVHQREEVANQQVAAQQASMRQQAEVQQRYQTAEDAANKQIAASQDAIKRFKFRDYFADGEGGTDWVRKIGAALAAAAGAYGAGMTHGPNFALQILNKDMDDAHAHQVGELEKMKDEEVMQRTGLGDIRTARQKALADLTINDAARDRLVATQLDQIAARQKTAEFAPGLAAAAAKLHQDATEKDALAKKQLVDLNLKLQDEGRKKTLDEASITEKTAQAKHLDALTSWGPNRKAHAAGGSGGTGAHAPDPEGLAAAIRNGVDGRPLNDVEIIHAAKEHNIPLAGKAGVVTLDKVRSVAKFDADAAIKAHRAGVQDERIDETKFKDFEKEHGLPKLEFTQHKLSEVLKKLDTGNPVGAMSSLMEFDAAAKGGNATEASMHAIQGRLGGLWTQIKGAVEKGESGNFGADQIATLRGAVQDALVGNKETVDKVHSAFGQQFDYSKPGVKQRAAGMFGALGYRGAGSDLAAPKVTAVKMKDGTIAHFDASGKRVD